MLRRKFLLMSAAATAQGARLSYKERVDRALDGKDLDRPPYTLWYHFGVEKEGPAKHASATLDFQRRFQTDLVKVMSDFPFRKPGIAGSTGTIPNWWEVRVTENPFPEQVKALTLIRDGLDGRKYFVETIFNPWNVAEKLSSKEEVMRMKSEQPQKLLNALEAIAKSEANHARKAMESGASGIFLAIANAQDGILSEADYAKFSEPFDQMVLDAARGARLNILHLHGEKVYMDRFYSGWPATVIQYSLHGTGVPIASVRKRYSGVIMGGIDERNFRTLTADQMKSQMKQARAEAGAKLILAPGCSVPNDTKDDEIRRLMKVL